MGFDGGAGADFSNLGETTFVPAVVDGGVDEVMEGEVTGTAAEVDDLFKVALYPDPLNRVSWGRYVVGFAGLIHHTTLWK